MLKTFYPFFFCLSLFLVGGHFIYPQTYYDHDTGNIIVSVSDDGWIGHGGGGAGGSGVIFEGNINACFTAGIVYGDPFLGVVGMIGSFGAIQDMNNIVPFNFNSSANFDQISTFQMSDFTFFNMRITQTTYSNAGDDFVFIKYSILNGSGNNYSDLYFGIFCDWDVGGNNFLLNRGEIDENRNLIYNWENGGAMDPSYYGIITFNGLDGGTSNDQVPPTRLLVYDAMTVLVPPPAMELDHRTIVGDGPYSLQNGETLAVGFGIVAGNNLADLQANTDIAQSIWESIIVPVELTSFTANVNNEGNVVLNWRTATELNNQMFEIERKSETGQYTTIGYVEGFGTTTEPQEYSYIDNTVGTGTYFYRLKQIDFGGQYEYSDEIEVEVNGPLTFALEQNYPNPFNPSTNIKYSVPENGFVKLSVYNLVGEEVSVLVNETVDAGFYEVTFNAANLPSGTYFYRLQTGNTVQAKKMVLLK